MKIIIRLNKRDLDITQNSQAYPAKKSIELVRRMNVSIMGIKELKLSALKCP